MWTRTAYKFNARTMMMALLMAFAPVVVDWFLPIRGELLRIQVKVEGAPALEADEGNGTVPAFCEQALAARKMRAWKNPLSRRSTTHSAPGS
jgi:hypothetical protein